MRAPILITGAAGRIGTVLTEGLHAAGVPLKLTDVRRPERLPQGVRFARADVTNSRRMAEVCEGADAVVHLAGHPNSRDWATVERLNMIGARVVFEAALNAGATRVIYASSVHAVGLLPADAALGAEPALVPDSPYGVSKAYGETLLRYLCAERGARGFALRICSFRPAPGSARELRTWISPADTVRLVLACLTAETTGTEVIWGVSDNTRAVVDREAWARVGYRPEDDAERHVERLRAEGVDTEIVSEFPQLGAHFVAPTFGSSIA